MFSAWTDGSRETISSILSIFISEMTVRVWQAER